MKKNLFVVTILLFSVVFTYKAFAIMPPYVYKEAIEESEIKAIAEVVKVRQVSEDEHKITNSVEFKLIKSYDNFELGDTFSAICHESKNTGFVGGTIYYYPKVGDEVFVTARVEGGEITSYTIITKELRAVLDKGGLECLTYGVGQVSVCGADKNE